MSKKEKKTRKTRNETWEQKQDEKNPSSRAPMKVILLKDLTSTEVNATTKKRGRNGTPRSRESCAQTLLGSDCKLRKEANV